MFSIVPLLLSTFSNGLNIYHEHYEHRKTRRAQKENCISEYLSYLEGSLKLLRDKCSIK